MARNKEGKFQDMLIKELEDYGCIVLKNDANYKQGFPDLTVFGHEGVTIILEVKSSRGSTKQPNQEYYLEQLYHMGFHAFLIYPENKEETMEYIYSILGGNL
jgi:Holliday junction resolvase